MVKLAIRRQLLRHRTLVRDVRKVARPLWSELRRSIEPRLPAYLVTIALLLIPVHGLFDLDSRLDDVLSKASYLSAEGRATAPSSIGVVLIDDQTLSEVGREAVLSGEHISRAYLAQVLTRVVEGSKPAVVAIDVLLDQPSDDDSALVAALETAAKSKVKVVLAARLVPLGTAARPLLPLARFRAARDGGAGPIVGQASLLADNDGVTRAANVYLPAQELLPGLAARGLASDVAAYHHVSTGSETKLVFWSFFAAAHLASSSSHPHSLVSRFGSGRPLFLDLTEPMDSAFKIVSAASLTRGVGAELTKKVVFIGADYESSPDRHRTALSATSLPFGNASARELFTTPLPGVLLQAYALQSLRDDLAGDAPWRPGKVLLLVPALAGALVGLLVGRDAVQRSLLVGWLVPLVLVSALSIVLFQLGAAVLPIVQICAAYSGVLGAFTFFQARARRLGRATS